MCIAAANYIINAANEYNKGKSLKEKIFLSSKRLQKLLFFSDVLYMVENNGDSMFHDEFYAWPSGPVIPSVYREFMQYQDGEMKPHNDSPHASLAPAIESVISRVLEDTNNLDTIDLIRKSHETGSPWKAIFNENDSEFNRIIDKKAIFDYYSEHGAPYGNRTRS
jgi:uncharacterized phage-associated protein